MQLIKQKIETISSLGNKLRFQVSITPAIFILNNLQQNYFSMILQLPCFENKRFE